MSTCDLTGYELAELYKECRDAMRSEDDDSTIEAYLETLNMLQDSMEVKAENTCHIVMELKRDSDYLAEEIKRLQARKKSIDNNRERLVNMFDSWLSAANIKKLQTPHYQIGYRKSVKTVVTDESKVPPRFITFTPKVSLTDIKNYLKEENITECEFAKLEETRSMNIK